MPAPDDWDALAEDFEAFVEHRHDTSGPWADLVRCLLNSRDSRRDLLYLLENQILNGGPITSAASAFPMFIEWWSMTSCLPPSVHTQEPTAVEKWLTQLCVWI